MKTLIFLTLIVSIGLANAMPTDEGPNLITVQEKWTKVISDGKSVRGLYLFSDMEGNVYSIEDTYWHWDFSAANRYAAIQPGTTYRMWFFGIRMPFFSWYQNAYRIEAA